MFDGNYYSYFIKNYENEIYTKDDDKLIELIKAEYNISNYLKNLEEKKPAPNSGSQRMPQKVVTQTN